MGDMTVASPTTGIALAAAFDTARPALKCLSCGTRADAGEPYCAHCGAQVALPIAKGRVASIAATRALQFGALVIVANLVLALASVGVLYFLSDSARIAQAGMLLDGLKLVVVGSLAAVAIRTGIRGLRETRDGRLTRRRWAIGGIVIGAVFAVLVTSSFAATSAFAFAG